MPDWYDTTRDIRTAFPVDRKLHISDYDYDADSDLEEDEDFDFSDDEGTQLLGTHITHQMGVGSRVRNVGLQRK